MLMNKQAAMEQIREEAFRCEMAKIGDYKTGKYLIGGSSFSEKDLDDRINYYKKNLERGIAWPLRPFVQNKLNKAIELKNYYYGNG